MSLDARVSRIVTALHLPERPGAAQRAFLQTLSDADLTALKQVVVACEAGEPLNAQQTAVLHNYAERWAAFVEDRRTA